ncbi:MAG: aspartate kinase [Candidatus Limnocylindrales bacterium]
MPAAPLVVQKVGGSSLADADRIRRVARRIARERASGANLVIVVSAMGDTTDELLGLAAAITDNPDQRELDMLLATGEHQSATLVSMALHALGVGAISLTGPQAGIATDGRYGNARISSIEPARIRAEIERGKVVIVAGFQGRSAKPASGHERTGHAQQTSDGRTGQAGDWRTGQNGDGRTGDAAASDAAPVDTALSDITTLGRGGSDTTAVALAARLRADRCQIFTDVRGIYTADPRLVRDARQLSIIGYEEMLELAHQGAQVMQTRAVELGWVNDVVIEVLSSFEDAPGTLIKEDPFVEQRNKVRGLAHDRNVAKVTLVEVPDRPGVAAHVFDPLAEAGINVDMIVQNIGHGGATDLSFTVPRLELAKVKRILEPIARELGFRELTTDSSVAKVSIIGAGIQNAPGYAARMFRALADAGVNIEMISTSEIRITTIIAEDALETALQALHAAFELERPESAAFESATANLNVASGGSAGR